MMRIRNKEYQSLGLKELRKLCYDHPNDAKLGYEIRKLAKIRLNVKTKELR